MVLTRFYHLPTFLTLVCFSLPCAAETVLLDFSSPGCGPCQQMRPTINRLAAAGFRVHEINIQSEPQVAARFRVTQVPAFIVMVDGRETGRLIGPTSYQKLYEMLTQRSTPPPIRQPELRGQSPDTFAASALQQPAANSFLAVSTGPATSPVGSGDKNKRLIEASVKIAVQDSDGTSTGTGTIIDSRSGEALVLTCGHLFRTSAGKGPITVTLFQAGPAGVEERTIAAGRLVNYDLERDLALVSIRTNVPVRPAPIAQTGPALALGTVVTTVGCNHGQNPTAIRSQITANDRYQGPPNVEVAGAPVEGRSGGGLFNAEGHLIGVCFAADPEANEGLYAALPSIIAKLDSLGLSMVYQMQVAATPLAPLPQQPLKQPFPISESSFAVRGQEPAIIPPQVESPLARAVASSSRASLSPSEQATLEEIQRRSENSEVICIIRPKNAEGKSEVISLSNASPQFIRSLAKLAGDQDKSRR